ncbi:methyltransferase domain-containing protein [Paenibacillaceae bacterium]|nr:methyltransferase domain-containing protein [Paenibacillaceae bacterium]
MAANAVESGGNKMKLDLGCGQNKQLDYTGLDRFLLPGVDVVCDINEGLPFASSSATRMMASHCLEHVEDLISTMEELYRVCQHKAILCILAPYAHTSLNMANPYHKFHFNEHTPRFFTNSNNTLVHAEEYAFPYITQWGLGETENNKLDMDFRCIRMEFFYFPCYMRLSISEQRRLRQSQINVADQIMYHLVAVKEPISPSELKKLARSELDVPAFVHLRRAHEGS